MFFIANIFIVTLVHCKNPRSYAKVIKAFIILKKSFKHTQLINIYVSNNTNFFSEYQSKKNMITCNSNSSMIFPTNKRFSKQTRALYLY